MVSYSYGDKLEEGHKLTLEHHISFDQRHADLSALTWMPLDRLQALRNKSVEAEKTVFRDLQEAAKRWEEQAAQTMILDKAIEYVKTPEVQHSGNRWEDTDYGWRSLILGVQLRPRPPDTYAALLRELSAIGNNINQIAHTVNGQKYAADSQIDQAVALVHRAWRLVKDSF